MDNSFTHVAVQVPRLSGFDKSHQNLLTSKVGTITPILIDELIPGSKVHLSLALSAQLPPLAADTFMRCDIRVEAFFCPFRLLAGSFESWFTDTSVQFQGPSSTYTETVGFLPVIGNIAASEVDASGQPLALKIYEAGGLFDYLGLKASTNAVGPNNFISALPALCYHRVYDDWYRNTLVQRPVFLRPSTSSSGAPASLPANRIAGTAPYYFFSASAYQLSTYLQLGLADGKYLHELRQRNFGLDYFTTATPRPQLGQPMVVGFGVDSNGAGDSNHFSIAALRAANSLQQFEERNNLAGTRYQDQLRARYGSNLSNGVAQRSLFLKSAVFPVYSKGIYTQGQDTTGSVNTNNPFQGTTGARFGNASASGRGLTLNFEANEPGYLLVNATLVPRVTYSSGINRRFTHYVGAGSVTDMANPILQNVGPQPIYVSELTGGSGSDVFGYTDKYAEFKTMEDELHGILRDGGTLDAFALQRSFPAGSTPSISSSFLEIPTTYMDQVTAVTGDLSNYGYWLDTYFDYRVAQPLAKYSLPSLQDPAYEHGKTIVMQKGGQKL